MTKSKLGGNQKWLGIAVLVLLIVGGIYYFSTYNNNQVADNQVITTGGVKNLAAVGATTPSDTIDTSKRLTQAKVATTSSPRPEIAITAWPTLEMKYGTAGNEINLVAKVEYSITAKGGKIFVPLSWGVMGLSNTSGQYASPTKVENKSIDPVVTTSCYWGSTCYVIPKGKTIRFITRQVYNPLVMFGGVYSAKLNWLYYLTSATDPSLYFSVFPVSTIKVQTITVVGEKSPYLYTTVLEVNQGDNIALKGIRLTGAKPIIEGGSILKVIQQDDSYITFSAKLTPGVYRMYMSHPIYGNSNSAWVTVKTTQPAITVISPNGGESLQMGSNREIIWNYNAMTSEDTRTPVLISIFSFGKGFEGKIGYVTMANGRYLWPVGDTMAGKIPLEYNPYYIRICSEKGVCDNTDSYFKITK